MINIIILPPWKNIPQEYVSKNGTIKEDTKVLMMYSEITRYAHACIYAIGMCFSRINEVSLFQVAMKTLLTGMLAQGVIEFTSLVTPDRDYESMTLEEEIRDGLWAVGKNKLRVITTDSIYQLLQNSRTLFFQKEADARNGLVRCSVTSLKQWRRNG